QPVGRMTYELADGSTVEYNFGLAVIEFMGEITSGRAIFGPEDTEPILGVTALESVGITVDPATRTLKRLPAIPLKWRREGLIMGLTVLEIEVGNPANPDITEKIEFLIDSGAIYSVVSTPILERLGIRPLTE